VPQIVRVGDIFTGTCFCHSTPVGMSGIIVKGAGKSICEGSPIGRIGDLGIGFCGHPTLLVSGASKSICEGSPISRIGDNVSGCIVGSMVTGATKSFCE
jgi:hypothetical protein